MRVKVDTSTAKAGKVRAALAVALLLALGGAPAVAAGQAGEEASATVLKAAVITVDIEIGLGGLGAGRVQSTDANDTPDGLFDCESDQGTIDDPSHCKATLELESGALFYFRVTPRLGSTACYLNVCFETPKSYVISVTVNSHIAVRFNLLPFDLTVHKEGSGSGYVFGTDQDIDCGNVCAVTLEYGHAILLSAIPDAGSTFDGWTGACAGQQQDCLISVIADTDTTARFKQISSGSSGPPKTAVPATAPPSPAVTHAPEESDRASESGVPTASAGTLPTPDISPTEGPTVVPAADSGLATGIALVASVLMVAAALAFLGYVIYRRSKAPASK